MVLKVDIDHTPIELSVVKAIAEDPRLTALVDELFFEFHFWFDGLDFGWGGGAPAVPAAPSVQRRIIGRGHGRGLAARTATDARRLDETRAESDALRLNRTVDDALRLMRKLRERGVRAHFWI